MIQIGITSSVKLKTQNRRFRISGLPRRFGRHLVVKLSHDPDWVWSLRYVREPKDNSTDVFNIRIFSPQEAEQKHVTISDYASLSSHPDLILFMGWYDKKINQVMIQEVAM